MPWNASYAEISIVDTMPSSELCRVELVLAHFGLF